MPTKSAFSVVGLSHKFGLAWEAAGGTLEDLNALAQKPARLRQALAITRGLATSKLIDYLIDCDADPRVPEGNEWYLDWNRKMGTIKWNPFRATLYVSPLQKRKGGVRGFELRKALADKPVLNVNARDFLLANKFLIPDSWEGLIIPFWGTIFRFQMFMEKDLLVVPCLHGRDGCWRADDLRLDCDFDERTPTPILKNGSPWSDPD